MHSNKHLFLFLLLWITTNIPAQIKISRTNDIPIINNSVDLQFPWTGGLFNPQFYSIDLDFDNEADLVIFDDQGDQVLVFTNATEAGQEHRYSFRAELDTLFPQMTNWMQLRDFNCDGVEDLLTYNPATENVSHYKGVTGVNGLIGFQFQDSIIQTFNGQEFTPLPFKFHDRPAFEDIDNDGDLDVIFFNAFDQIDHHVNRSMELYGHCDSLTFEFVTDCWGTFKELQPDLYFDLDVTCDSVGFTGELLHTGSSRIQPIDYGGDGIWDIIAGYGHEQKLGLLTNGGDAEEAFMTSVDNDFPNNDTTILLPSFPAAYHLDVDGDDEKELVVSSSFKGKAEDNVWLYQNMGTAESPIWEKEKSNFLQDQMIDAGANAKPTFVDYNGDGLSDLVLGNRGLASELNAGIYNAYLTLYENIGTSSEPIFTLVEKDWMNISSLNKYQITATFGDLDGDGDQDLVFGDFGGQLLFIENIAAPGMEILLDTENALDMDLDVGFIAAPQLVDVDEDGLLDLLVGEAQGRVFYYNNTGTASTYNFILSNDFFGGIDVRPSGGSLGYASPFLFRPAPEKPRVLLVGNLEGKVFGFEGVDDFLAVFNPVLPELSIIQTGEEAGPAVLSTDESINEHYILTGTLRGGIQLYNMADDLPSSIEEFPLSGISKNTIKVFPNPLTGSEVKLWFPSLAKSKAGTLFLYDMQGTKIEEYFLELQTGKDLHQIDFSILKNRKGLFFIQWLSADGEQSFLSDLFLNI